MNPDTNPKTNDEVNSGMNLENTSGVSQNVMSQNAINQNIANQDFSQTIANQNAANQNVTSQNASFPDPNLQPAQSPLAQNSPLSAPPSKSKKSILVACVVGALVLAMTAVGIIGVVTMRDNSNLSDGTASNTVDNSNVGLVEEVGSGVVDVIDVEKFKQMTKAEAIAFLQAGRSTGGNMPKNYVDKVITDLVVVNNGAVSSDVLLRYSHESINDLRKIAEDWYGILGHNDGITEDDYEIKEYDYYVIVTPNRIEGTNTCDEEYYGNCNSLLSFKRDYINYYQEETTPNSYNDVLYLNTQNLELVEYLLRAYSFFYSYGAASTHGNIYGSSFEDQDDKFVLTVYYVGVGLDMEKLKEGGGGVEYAVNLYSRQYAADKSDGRLHVIRTGEDSTVNNIASIPITEEEAVSLLSR